ncbi:hypothetical protein [Saccharothrix hoggarensis]|uniref:Uncharacterized protein n=1 Tax=Saccharothrix hoggarensis TaxID=913853 RepID=A0ABW3R5D3_9PSEU
MTSCRPNPTRSPARCGTRTSTRRSAAPRARWIEAADALGDEPVKTATGHPVGDEVHPERDGGPEGEVDPAMSAVLAVVAIAHRIKTPAGRED